jgi:hypothetical protein
MDGKFLGKITSVKLGPDRDRGFGLALEFSFRGAAAQWFEPITSLRQLDNLVGWCRVSKSNDVYSLKDKPVEVEVQDNLLKSWRILTEVL